MITLITLPEVIFRLLQTILTNDDYHYLLNASKQHLRDLKRRTMYFRLNEVKSKQYMKDKVFQSYVLSLVEDGWKQIRVYWNSSRFMSWYDRTVPSDCREFLPVLFNRDHTMSGVLPLSSNLNQLYHLHDINQETLGDISHLTKLRLISPDDVVDLSLFQHIPDLEIDSTYCDVTIFSNDHQKRLYLNSCFNLTNVESFKGIHILKIQRCDGVIDVSPLYGIYDLSLISCRKLRDISGLGNHCRLHVEKCSKNLIGYESLEGIPHVTLIGCDISDVSVLRDAKSVKLEQCIRLQDVSPIKNVKKVELYQCLHITNIIELCDVYDLSIDEFSIKATELPKLRNYRLSITFSQVEFVKGRRDRPYVNYFDDCFSHTSHLLQIFILLLFLMRNLFHQLQLMFLLIFIQLSCNTV